MRQVEELDILQGCLGWRLERVARGQADDSELVLRFGPLYRLQLLLRAQDPGTWVVHHQLELTRPGEASRNCACHVQLTNRPVTRPIERKPWKQHSAGLAPAYKARGRHVIEASLGAQAAVHFPPQLSRHEGLPPAVAHG